MKLCGEMGHRGKNGKPCGYRIAAMAKACPHHSGNPAKARAFQSKGALASKMRHALPPDFKLPDLDTLDGIEKAGRLLFELSLKRNLERWRLSEARGALTLLVEGQKIRVEQQMLNTLMALEHGGAAMVLLAQIQEGITQGRPLPLPGRTLAITGKSA